MGDVAIGFEAPAVGLPAGGDGGDAGDQEFDENDQLGGGEGGEQGASGEGGEQGAAGEGGEQGGAFRAVEDGKLSQVAKAAVEKLKAENPALARAVQRALFAEDRIRRELPGGFKDIAKMRERIEELGGDEGIQTLQEELDGWKDFDTKYTAGDPAVLEFLTETPAAKDAFLKIAPAAFEKFREFHPEGYSAYVSQVFMADMQGAQIPMAIQLLGSLINRAQLSDADKTEATNIYSTLAKYYNRLSEFAAKPVAPTKAAGAAGAADPRATELETRETNLRKQEWETAAQQQHGRIFGDAWKRLAASIPKDKVNAVRRLYGLHLQEKIAQRRDFDAKMGNYFKRHQKDGFLRLHESTFRELVPLALRSAMAEAGINPRKAPGAGAAGAGSGAAAQAAGQRGQAPAGFTMVAKKPNFATEVDRIKTTPDMYSRKQAVLKDGKRVTWA